MPEGRGGTGAGQREEEEEEEWVHPTCCCWRCTSSTSTYYRVSPFPRLRAFVLVLVQHCSGSLGGVSV